MKTTVRLDLNNPVFQRQLFGLDKQERNQVLNTLRKLSELTWEQVYSVKGLRWERILTKIGSNGENLYSLRVSHSFRAVAHRDGDWLCLDAVHPDHDSTYL